MNTTTMAARALLERHLNAFLANDLDAVLADYTDGSVLITAEASYSGRAAIRAFFAKLMPHFPTAASRFELDTMTVEDEVAFITWHAHTPTLEVPLATDTFVIRDGSIRRQTFAGHLQPVAAATA